MANKPKLYVRGKYARAACDLVDEMASQGVVCTVGYTTPRDGRLYVEVRNPSFIELVPSEWCEFKVLATPENPDGFSASRFSRNEG